MSRHSPEFGPGKSYAEYEQLDQTLHLGSVQASDKFIQELLAPSMESFIGAHQEYLYESKKGRTWDSHDRYDLSVNGLGGPYQSYVIEAFDLHPFEPDAASWSRFIAAINADEDIAEELDELGEEYFIHPDASRKDYDIVLFSSWEYIFRAGKLPTKVLQAGYTINGESVSFYYADGKYLGDGSNDTKLDIDALEHDFTKDITEKDMVAILEALEVFDLYRIPRSGGLHGKKIIPQFS